jgi:hypothetical protein
MRLVPFAGKEVASKIKERKKKKRKTFRRKKSILSLLVLGKESAHCVTSSCCK